MGIDIQVRIDLSPAQKRVMRGAVVVGVVTAALGLGLAAAAPHQWAASDPLKAADLNGLNVVSNPFDGGISSYSVGATKFCGLSASTISIPATYAGATGYAAMKKLCEAAPGCGSYAHMCSGDELARSASIGINLPGGSAGAWYQSGTAVDTGTEAFTDCDGWLTSSSVFYGGLWVNNPGNGQNGPSFAACTTSQYVFCCD